MTITTLPKPFAEQVRSAVATEKIDEFLLPGSTKRPGLDTLPTPGRQITGDGFSPSAELGGGAAPATSVPNLGASLG